MRVSSKKTILAFAIASILLVAPTYSAAKTTDTKNSEKKVISKKIDEKKVKNVIMLIPDGANISSYSLARWYEGGNPLAVDSILTGLVRTYNADTPIADSAPAGTAMSTGMKTNTKYVGVNPSVAGLYNVPEIVAGNEKKPLATVLAASKLLGKATGIVATSNIQHATPADFTAHTSDRSDYFGIGEQQVYNELDVALGGGSKYLEANNRPDKEDMIAELKNMGYEIVNTKDQLTTSKSSKLYGLFAPDAMAYDLDRAETAPTEPTLEDMTKKAIDTLAKNKNGFFLMEEGSKGDRANQANDPVATATDMLAFDKAVNAALEFAKKDGNTVVIVAADHGTGGLSMGNKDSSSNYDKLTLNQFMDPIKAAKLTGEGLEKKLDKDRTNIVDVMKTYYGINDLTDDEIKSIQEAKEGSLNYTVGPIISKRAYIGWTTNGHTGEEVALYSYHPKNKTLNGLVQNTDIAKYIEEVLGLDLKKANEELYNNVIPVLNEAGLNYYWNNNGNFVNPELVITDDTHTLNLPANKDFYTLDGKKIKSSGINVFVDGENFYVSKEIIDLFPKN